MDANKSNNFLENKSDNFIENERYKKLFYKYCFYCKKCQRSQKLLNNASLPVYPSDCIFYHTYTCCKEKKELQKKIEKEVNFIHKEGNYTKVRYDINKSQMRIYSFLIQLLLYYRKKIQKNE